MRTNKRDNTWLLHRLNDLWDKYFTDIPQPNRLFISFGRRAKFRFGSIRLEEAPRLMSTNQQTVMSITGLFQNANIPQDVVDYTIAHELVHYAHGFSSPLPQKFRHPHKGGVVHRDMRARGMERLVLSYKKWIKEYKSKFKWHLTPEVKSAPTSGV